MSAVCSHLLLLCCSHQFFCSPNSNTTLPPVHAARCCDGFLCVLLAFSFFLECQLANVRLSLQSFSDVPSTVPIALIIFFLSKLVDHLLASFVIF